MAKKTTIGLIALVSALIGVGGTALFYEWRAQSREAERAALSLHDHLTLMRFLDAGARQGVQDATRLLTLMADADVMRLMEINANRDKNPQFRSKVLTSYAQYRAKNPHLYQVPEYVDASGRAEYESNLKKIQQFLDAESSKSK